MDAGIDQDGGRDDLGDEPLPAGYGVRPQRQPDAARGEPARRDASGDSAEGESGRDEGQGSERRGRRRRRRRRGEGSGRESAVEAGGRSGSSQDGGRRGSRSGRSGRRSGDERRSSSNLSRGRRDDFAPVAGAREEDDEGLEFLGIEDGHDTNVRSDRDVAEDDESIVESGLNTVLDVPSWVEAIGIVIAGNLDSRNRSPRAGDGGRGDRSGGQGTRGGGADRPRDGRRGGRSEQ